ncbi:SRPBCC family protein [Undibacterium flavidum]|uniref:SRPBCC family protein n=1 Tax=Undibacterium flavidum TaxID=2762297 RepID=A0ABR6YDR7_9BURK|nr:SRPBCC family protein [Undibacterium flavidum]MBC3874704.1 SRPBCC family protein [Undibacterium flavidum]
MKITINTTVKAKLKDCWDAWTTPADIMQWNAANDDWHTPRSSNNLRVGGIFSSRMEAKDGSMGFDFEGTYTQVIPHELIEYALGDQRTVTVTFKEADGAVQITETFDAENEHSAEMQRAGWQAILDNFARYVESKAKA